MPAPTFVISPEQSELFGRISGDRNPIHHASDSAARSSFGRPIVHGIHTVLAALEACCDAVGPRFARPVSVSLKLPQPFFTGEAATVETVTGAGKTRLKVTVEGVTVATIALADTESAPERDIRPDKALTPPAAQPKQRDPADFADVRGALNLACDGDPDELFPRLSKVCDPALLRSLMRLSTVVGMEWPGQDSLFSGATLWIGPAFGVDDGVHYKVTSFDPRFNRTEIDVVAPHLNARMEAFFRPRMVGPPRFDRAIGLVGRGRFGGHQSLIIGGSNGLGAAAAVVLAAGGGRPVITYRSDRQGAVAIASMIRAGNGECDIVSCDVGNPRDLERIFEEFAPDSLMYFATPRIFRRSRHGFSPDLYREFHAFYVDAFMGCIDAALARRRSPLAVLYPSTVAIDAPVDGLSEYVAAKLAGEAVCAGLARASDHLSVLIERLPRILTAQTNSIIQAPAGDAVETMVATLDKFMAKTAPRSPLQGAASA